MAPPEKRQRTLVKICGVRSAEMARIAFDAGADAVGVVLVPGSPRSVTESTALDIAATAPFRTVLVLRDPDPEGLELARKWRGPVQFHSPFPPISRGHVRALASGLEHPPTAEPHQTAWLLDAPVAGSGQAWRWPTADALPSGLPVILAGGLDPENVTTAIRTALPWAVDVSSGVERERGVKDASLIQAFIHAVRACDASDGRTQDPRPAGFDALR